MAGSLRAVRRRVDVRLTGEDEAVEQVEQLVGVRGAGVVGGQDQRDRARVADVSEYVRCETFPSTSSHTVQRALSTAAVIPITGLVPTRSPAQPRSNIRRRS